MTTKKRQKRLLRCLAALIATLIVATIAGSEYMLRYSLDAERRSREEALERFYAREGEELRQWVDSVTAAGALRDTVVAMPGRGRQSALMLTAAVPNSRIAVCVHGYKDRAESMLHVARIYHRDLGCNVLLPHLYGHGDSEGDHIGMGWEERDDLRRWIDVATGKWGGGKAAQVALHGVSMGAAAVMSLSGADCPPSVKCIVEDCGYTSVWDEFAGELSNQFGLPEFPLMHTTSALCRLRYGWSFSEASPLRQVAGSMVPMLFIHGDSDTFVPYPMLDRLYRAKRQGYKEKLVARGSEHARAFTDHRDEYTARVTGFVSRFVE